KPLLGRSLRKTVVKISNFKATGLLRRYAPRNDGPKNRTVQSNSIRNSCICFKRIFAFFIIL
ncbi:hypothetical protein SC663_08810, partial [Legionella pneumophila serogroup 1]|nr:hypothetical protein [Legionella pneumophila]MDW9138091.1 hypothetical protein [Legionella pneumophila]MDW9142182.1 hypothetical protein [Legionella pneumophila]MDW9150503.1 hypothetical protein [Legionella pneumophila]MDW9161064.1 hypothetical protein [Legionella pneumophila]